MVLRPGSGAAGHTLGRRAHSVSGGKNPIRERHEVQLADSDKGAIHLSADLPQDGEAPHAKARAKQVHAISTIVAFRHCKLFRRICLTPKYTDDLSS